MLLYEFGGHTVNLPWQQYMAGFIAVSLLNEQRSKATVENEQTDQQVNPQADTFHFEAAPQATHHASLPPLKHQVC